MKWRDHVRITSTICKMFKIDCERVAQLSTVPDKDPDFVLVYRKGKTYKRRLRHHDPEAVPQTIRYLKSARKEYLRKKSFEEHLGRAIHYLQDYSIDVRKRFLIFKYRSDDAHKERESFKIDVDWKAVEDALNLKCKPHEMKDVIKSVKRGEKPDEIAYASSFLTAFALKMVLNPEKPLDLERNYRYLRRRHVTLILIPWFLLIFDIAFLILALILSILIHYLDFQYHRSKFDYEWFH